MVHFSGFARKMNHIPLPRTREGSTDFIVTDFNPPKIYISFSLRAVGSAHTNMRRAYGS
ncbi:MAG: hypothetical protein U5L45_22250 [Saprospiraceae bacterium]|nr:hypothetical protein [Saprospiraceae bacterium]